MPAIWGETRFNTLAYFMSRWRTPERRELEYIRYVGASAETAKEIKLFGLGDFLIARFKQLAQTIFLENRTLSTQRAAWGALFSAISTLTYYGAYGFIVWRTITGDFTIGDLAFLSGSFLRLNGLFQKILLGFTQIAGQSMYLDDLFSFFEIEPTILSPANPKAVSAADPAGHRLRECRLPLSRYRRLGHPAPELYPAGRAKRWRWWARTARARPPSSSC